jgi:hypothetical protein
MKTHFSWMVRFYVSGSCLVTAGIAMLDPWSQHREIMAQDGLGGLAAFTMLAAVAVLGLVDVLVNDWLPERFSVRWTHRHRHVVFMGLALSQCAMAFVEVRAEEVRPVVARYLLDAFVALLVACTGVYCHYWENQDAREVRK